MPEKLPKIMVVDDDVMLLELCADILSANGFQPVCEANSINAPIRVHQEQPDLVITDLSMPGLSGMELLEILQENNPDLPVIILSGNTTLEAAFQAIHHGAKDYVTKPFKPDELCFRIRNALEQSRLKNENKLLKKQLARSQTTSEIIGSSKVMQQVFSTIERAAPTDASVFIWGESGTGKELVARAIHNNSNRKDKSFIAVDCVAIPDQLIESELFGHVKGAFTGASEERDGLLQAANGGTLFLDEITEMNFDLQGKLLRVLQERKFRKVGGREWFNLDIRLIAATNRIPQQAIEEKFLRLDLYYRLNVIPINLPPLRERGEDILHLIHHFLERFTANSPHAVKGIERDALECLLNYSWPGNVRELQNVIERLVILADGPKITVGDLPPEIQRAGTVSDPVSVQPGPPPAGEPSPPAQVPLLPSSRGGAPSLPSVTPSGEESPAALNFIPCPNPLETSYHQARRLVLDQFQREYLTCLLKHFHGNVSSIARQCGLDRKTIHRLANELGIDPADYRV